MKTNKEILLDEYNEKRNCIVKALTADLKKMDIGFAPNLLLSIYNERVVLAIASKNNPENAEWASEVTIYPANVGSFPSNQSGISYPTSGTFFPEVEKNSGNIWRTLHAAVILKNWEQLIPLFTTACKKAEELKDEYYTKIYSNTSETQ